MQDNGYGSAEFLRVCRVAELCLGTDGSRLAKAWRRLRAGSLLVLWYRLRLPSITIRPTGSPAGQMIREHFSIREGGRWRFRGAQGVLPVPPEFSDYLSGRHRQAVRTNIGHARKAGLTIETYAADDWEPGSGDSRVAHISPGPVEWWNVLTPDGGLAAQAILCVDEEVALLHGLVSYAPHARWLLHTAIVERLCGNCNVLLTNSEDAYLLTSGNQHFQRLLGYGIVRLRLSHHSRERTEQSEGVPAITEGDLQGEPII
jgi:hypothetical protein